MSGRLPRKIDPFRLGEQQARLQGTIPVTDLSRLQSACLNSDGEIRLDLMFALSQNGLVIMQGKLSGIVTLTCQRCMGPMSYPVEIQLSMYFTKPGKQVEGIDETDTIVTTAETELYPLIEDEVLLALPMIAKHEETDCPASDFIKPGKIKDKQVEHPFAILNNLKSK